MNVDLSQIYANIGKITIYIKKGVHIIKLCYITQTQQISMINMQYKYVILKYLNLLKHDKFKIITLVVISRRNNILR